MGSLTKGQRLRSLEDRISQLSQCIDIACQFRAFERDINGTLVPSDVDPSPVYGGRYRIMDGFRVGDPESWVEFPCTRQQLKALTSDKKKVTVSGGRGSGKSELLVLWTIKTVCRSPAGYVPLVSPTYKKSKILWRKLLRQIPVSWLQPGRKGTRIADKQLKFVHRATIEFFSADSPDSIRGEDGVGGGIDEAQDCSEEAADNLRLTLRTSIDWTMLRVGTMKMGSDFHIEYMRQKEEPGALVMEFSSFENDFIPQGEGSIFEDARRTMDSRRFEQEVMGRAVSLSGLVYHAFNRFVHCKHPESGDTTRKVATERLGHPATHIVGVTYHLAPMGAVICTVHGDDILRVVDEIVLEDNASVATLAKKIATKYPKAIVCDSSPKDSLGGTSSWKMLRASGLRVSHPKRAALRIDRVNALNARFESAEGSRHVVIDPRCIKTIQALESYELDSGRVPIPQGNAVLTDALSFVAHRLWPPRVVGRAEIAMAA